MVYKAEFFKMENIVFVTQEEHSPGDEGHLPEELSQGK